jgi:hypothetical protein
MDRKPPERTSKDRVVCTGHIGRPNEDSAGNDDLAQILDLTMIDIFFTPSFTSVDLDLNCELHHPSDSIDLRQDVFPSLLVHVLPSIGDSLQSEDACDLSSYLYPGEVAMDAIGEGSFLNEFIDDGDHHVAAILQGSRLPNTTTCRETNADALVPAQPDAALLSYTASNHESSASPTSQAHPDQIGSPELQSGRATQAYPSGGQTALMSGSTCSDKLHPNQSPPQCLLLDQIDEDLSFCVREEIGDLPPRLWDGQGESKVKPSDFDTRVSAKIEQINQTRLLKPKGDSRKTLESVDQSQREDSLEQKKPNANRPETYNKEEDVYFPKRLLTPGVIKHNKRLADALSQSEKEAQDSMINEEDPDSDDRQQVGRGPYNCNKCGEPLGAHNCLFVRIPRHSLEQVRDHIPNLPDKWKEILDIYRELDRIRSERVSDESDQETKEPESGTPEEAYVTKVETRGDIDRAHPVFHAEELPESSNPMPPIVVDGDETVNSTGGFQEEQPPVINPVIALHTSTATAGNANGDRDEESVRVSEVVCQCRRPHLTKSHAFCRRGKDAQKDDG